MQLFSYFAVYFIVWWMTLFAVLPFGLRTQAEANEVVPGTVESAPARFRGGRVVLMTTIISTILYGAWYILSVRLGYGIDAIPQFMPDFR
jgi:predicted secreted protein